MKAWAAGLVSRPSWWQNLLRLLIDNLRDILSLLATVGLVGFYLYLWWKFGRGPRKGLVIPLFELPRGISPAMAGYVRHRGLAGDPLGVRALSIMLTDLAIRGWLRLQRNAEGLLLTRGEAPGDAICEEERRVLNALIASEDGSLTLGNRYEPRLTTALDGLLRSSSTPPQAPSSSDDFSHSGGGDSGSSSSASHGGGSSDGGAGGGGW